MAYDPNTRLLLKFGEAAGATTATDTSAQARTASFTAGSVSAAQGVFSTRSAPVGNPGGTITPSAVVVNNPNGVFSDGVMNRQFDVWYRMYGFPVTSSAQPLISMQFANGDLFNFEVGPTSVAAVFDGRNTDAAKYAYRSVTTFPPANTWRHYRILIAGNTLRIGANGAELGSVTITPDIWTGSATNLPVDIRFGLSPPIWAADATHRAQGYIDSVEFTEGAVTWSGGAYTVPTTEPDDAPLVSGVTGEGANTVEVSSFGAADVYDAINGVGTNTTEDCLGSGDVVHDAHFAEGANTTEDCLGDGYAAGGVVRFADGAGVVESVQSFGTLVATPISKGVGAATTISVTSIGDGGIDWRLCDSAVTLDDAVSVGAGTVSAFASSTGVGANTTSVSSIGAGQVPVQGEGGNTTAVSSVGTVKDEQYGSGANTVSVVGAGVASAYTPAWGGNVLQNVVSLGVGYGELFSAGSADVGVTSFGQGVVPIVGIGWGTTEVFTVCLDHWEPTTAAIYLHAGADGLSLQVQESAMVTT